MAAPVVASTGALYGSTTPPVPSGVTSGSLVVGFITAYSGLVGRAPTVGDLAVTGFTVDDVVSVDAPSHGQTFTVWRMHKYASGSDSGHYTITGCNPGGEDALDFGAIFRRITGGPTSGNPWVDLFLSGNRTTNGTSITIASHTPGGDDSLFLAASYLFDGSTTTWPSGWTRDFHDTSDGTMDGGSASQATATATGTLSWASATSTQGIVALSTIRPPASVVTGTGALVLPGFTASGSGTVINPVTGTGALHLPTFTASGSGTTTVPDFTGTGSLSLTSFTVTGDGTSTAPGFSGTGTLSLPSLTIDAAGMTIAPDFTGTGDLELDTFIIDGSGTAFAPGNDGEGVLILPALIVLGEGTTTAPDFAGTGALQLAPFTVVGEGAFIPQGAGTGVLELPGLLIDGVGAVNVPTYTGDGALILPVFVIAGEEVKPVFPSRRTLIGTPVTNTLTATPVGNTLAAAPLSHTLKGRIP